MKTFEETIEWGKKNPNFAYIWIWVIYFIIFFFMGLFSAMFGVDEEVSESVFYGAALTMMLIYLAPATVWILHQKGRSGWWVIPSMFSIGALIPLLLENKKKEIVEN